ncbi:hypothetical protein K0M31_012856 [Melipona bicolor]|uniref:Uncharacterized protein n=1 Tax=Melipona bicolor TaxID=60889 RepID=A0AA40KH43_9HYME|nr:hypothetical protein K0M31_012856 [Melipona bicolor]
MKKTNNKGGEDKIEEEKREESEIQYIWKEDKIQEFQGNLIQLWKMEWSALKPGEKMGKLNEIITAAGTK